MLSRRLVIPPRAHFSTLRSSRLTSFDWVDFSSKYYARARYTPTADSAVCHIPYHLPDGADIVPPGQRLRFPAGAAGFLYAHTISGHPAAGQVRLRCVPQADPTAFAAGHDLLLATGLPWAVPFFALGSGAVAPLRACLLAEALVARADLAHWAKGRTRGRTAAVHAPGEPFFYNFAHPTPHLAVLHGRDVHPMRFMPLGGTAFARPAPYTGVSATLSISTLLTRYQGLRTSCLNMSQARGHFCCVCDASSAPSSLTPHTSRHRAAASRTWSRRRAPAS
jgi:hypothetical protein